MKKLFKNILSLIILSMTIGVANATIITVDDSGGADYTKLQDAVAAANTGDTNEVRSGT